MRRMTKKRAWVWCSKYIRLRDAVEFHCRHPAFAFGYVACCTCGTIITWNKNCDAGHFISRGIGGSSGVYFDERNIHAQCKGCNAWRQGNPLAYRKFMLGKYGEETINELWLHHRCNKNDARAIAGYELYYKSEYNKLEEEYLKL